jgi:hypothetical protein
MGRIGDSPYHPYAESAIHPITDTRSIVGSEGVDFRLQISPRIRNQNREGLVSGVGDLCLNDLYKKIEKSVSLPRLTRRTVINKYLAAVLAP